MSLSQYHRSRPSVAGLARGTSIATERGEIAVEDLLDGDRVLTRDHGYRPLIWSGCLSSRPQHGTVRMRIAPGSFGAGRPHRHLDLGPGHRLLLAGPRVALHTGEHEAFAAAGQLAGTALQGRTPALRSARLYDVLLRDHELILANGAWCESTFAHEHWFKTLPSGLGRVLRDRIGAPHDRTARLCLSLQDTAAILGHPLRRAGLAA
jgi:hypothetical protein